MDIDIDTPTDFIARTVFPNCIVASRVNNERLSNHPAGVYFQNVPTDPITGLSAIPFSEAEQFDFFKVDFLHLGLRDYFDNKDQLLSLLDRDPNWSLLTDDDVIPKLFQLRNNGDLLKYIKPQSVEELADCIALIRPAKISLQDKYIVDREQTRRELYKMPLPKGCFKKAHAIAYAFNVIVQLHLIENGIYDE